MKIAVGANADRERGWRDRKVNLQHVKKEWFHMIKRSYFPDTQKQISKTKALSAKN